MVSKVVVLTPEGLEHLKAELKELKEVKRPEVIERIKRAKEFGDLSENTEYQYAKDDQSFIEGRVQEIEALIKSAKVVEKKHSPSVVDIGSSVTVALESDRISYQIVGPTEADVDKYRISSESPVGRALIGHKKGERVKVAAPGGDIEYKILEVK